MRIILDALPMNHLSGRHVFLGYLNEIAREQCDRHQFGKEVGLLICFFPRNGDLSHHPYFAQSTFPSLVTNCV